MAKRKCQPCEGGVAPLPVSAAQVLLQELKGWELIDGKLSIASPLGKSLLGKKKGEKFLLNLPKASVPYKVIKVERG